MPPPKTHKTLTASAERDCCKRWIAAGAEYQPHWSFIAAEAAAAAGGQERSRGSATRSTASSWRSWRRTACSPPPRPTAGRWPAALSLDLTGLPPDPAEVEAFVNDTAPDAYEKLVDRLLASPHWGEHRGRYWLDAARYADTHGIHFDNYREMWAYRDWVIDAFNRNLPFDRFTIEQLAGDLLPNRTLDQQVASGFNRCNITTNEGGAIPEEYLVLYTRDRTETTSQVWLGLTAGCAVCHDHKFDPLTPARVLRAVGVLQQHDAGGDGRQHQGHAADRRSCRGRRTAPRWDALPKRAGRGPQADRGAQADGPRRVRQMAAPADAEQSASSSRPTACASTPAERGQRQDGPPDGRRQAATSRRWRRPAWDAGPRRRQGVQEPARRRRSKWPTPATSRRTRRSPTAPGSSCPRPSRPARSSPGWTTSTTTAAGTCGSRTTASARTSSTSGRTTRSRSSPRRRSSRASGTTCSSPTTARARRPA